MWKVLNILKFDLLLKGLFSHRQPIFFLIFLWEKMPVFRIIIVIRLYFYFLLYSVAEQLFWSQKILWKTSAPNNNVTFLGPLLRFGNCVGIQPQIFTISVRPWKSLSLIRLVFGKCEVFYLGIQVLSPLCIFWRESVWILNGKKNTLI